MHENMTRRTFVQGAGAVAAGLGLMGLAGCGSSTDSNSNANSSNTNQQASDVVTQTKQDKLRTVITTDGEVDDRNSVIRALLYSNNMDIAGIVLTSSTYHYAGDPDKGIDAYRWTGTEWVNQFLDAYAEVYDNLKSHDDSYPTADSLRANYKIGNIKNVGEMDEVTEGSEFLKDLFLDDDPRTLYVQTWGGTNTTARALKSIEEQYKDTDQWSDIQQKIYDKLLIFIILDQDDSYSSYIAPNWPGLKIINDRSNFWHFAYMWKYNPDQVNTTLKADWEYTNLIDGKGPLMELYSLMDDGKWIDGELDSEQRGVGWVEANPDPHYDKYDFISEGDSPSFFYLLDTGLRSVEDPSYGGWGGRFGQTSSTLWENTALDYDPYTNQYEAQYTLERWFDEIQNDFANRADWCTTADDTAVNHAPSVSVTQGIDITAAPGETVTLTAVGEDQDEGQTLSYHWWRYFEADTYQDSEVTTEVEDEEMGGILADHVRKLGDGEQTNTIEITNPDQAEMSFTVPSDAKSGDTIHMVVDVTDDGAHTLKHHQRVIITVQ